MRDQAAGLGQGTVAIVGGGFCGLALAIQLLRRADVGGRLVLFEPAPLLGGVAYTTEQPRHLLNVPADRMSLFPERPDDFVQFAGAAGWPDAGLQFLPRPLYGAYLRAAFAQAAEEAGDRLEVVRDEVRAVRPQAQGWVVEAGGAQWEASSVVLASGNGPPIVPGPLRKLGAVPEVITEPYRLGALAAIDPDAAVLVLGMRLTAVDILESLASQGHRGPVFALSRRARWPAEHLPEVRWRGEAPTLGALPEPLTADGLAGWFRAAVEAAEARSIPWQAVADAVRPRVQRLWQELPEAEQTRFLSQHRGAWEWVRHRLPAQCAEALRGWERSGWLTPLAGEIAGAAQEDAGLVVRLRTPEGAEALHRFGAVVCGAGRLSDPRRFGGHLWPQLIGEGLAQPDQHGLGVQAAASGEVHGAPAGLYALGSLLRPTLFESTAVPELALQAAALAAHIAAGVAE
jgi:uncharacterized NAD(P)/FAD-binding protein YdhS